MHSVGVYSLCLHCFKILDMLILNIGKAFCNASGAQAGKTVFMCLSTVFSLRSSDPVPGLS